MGFRTSVRQQPHHTRPQSISYHSPYRLITPTTMPSRSNPNTPSSSKRKTAHTLKTKRQNTQRLTRNKITKPTLRTSQALRRAAPPSGKKAKKLERNEGFARRRKMEEMGEVEMRDADAGSKKQGMTDGGGKVDAADEKMEVDMVE